MTQEIIESFASRLNTHPIHLRMFLSANKSIALENLDSAYMKFADESPKPFVKWVGGKRQLLRQFRQMDLYPPFDFNPEEATYFEPFVGGGAMFFDLLPERACLSDMNVELVTAYNVIKKDVAKLIEALGEHQKNNSKEYFLKVRAFDLKNLSDVAIAARFIYLNRTCFNGLYRVNRKGEFNVPYGKNASPLICDEDNLRKISQALKKTKITHQDYKKVLEQAKKGDFIYFDPPYYPVSKTAAFTSYTKEGFLEKEQEELRDAFLELHKKGCFVMLSNSNSEFIVENLYANLGKEIKIHQVEASRAINSKGTRRGKIKEVVVINY